MTLNKDVCWSSRSVDNQGFGYSPFLRCPEPPLPNTPSPPPPPPPPLYNDNDAAILQCLCRHRAPHTVTVNLYCAEALYAFVLLELLVVVFTDRANDALDALELELRQLMNVRALRTCVKVWVSAL